MSDFSDAMDNIDMGERTEGDIYASQTGFIFPLSGGAAICEMVTPNESCWTPEAKANAAYIVTAWNSHAGMLEACISAVNYFGLCDCGLDSCSNCGSRSLPTMLRKAIDKAISKGEPK